MKQLVIIITMYKKYNEIGFRFSLPLIYPFDKLIIIINDWFEKMNYFTRKIFSYAEKNRTFLPTTRPVVIAARRRHHGKGNKFSTAP